MSFPLSLVSFSACNHYTKTSSIPQIQLNVLDKSFFASHRNSAYNSLPKGLCFIGGICLFFIFSIKECQGHIIVILLNYFLAKEDGVCVYV